MVIRVGVSCTWQNESIQDVRKRLLGPVGSMVTVHVSTCLDTVPQTHAHHVDAAAAPSVRVVLLHRELPGESHCTPRGRSLEMSSAVCSAIETQRKQLASARSEGAALRRRLHLVVDQGQQLLDELHLAEADASEVVEGSAHASWQLDDSQHRCAHLAAQVVPLVSHIGILACFPALLAVALLPQLYRRAKSFGFLLTMACASALYQCAHIVLVSLGSWSKLISP